jgi:hypothetical protein
MLIYGLDNGVDGTRLICIVVCEPRTAHAAGVMEMIFEMRLYIFITSKFKFDSLGRP